MKYGKDGRTLGVSRGEVESSFRPKEEMILFSSSSLFSKGACKRKGRVENTKKRRKEG